MGRQTEFTAEIADIICERIADGESLRSICLDEDMPGKSTVFQWLAGHAEFADQYARAREAQADSIVDEMLDIADDGTNDYITKENSDGSTYEAVNSEHIQRSKLRIDARKWVAGKLKPKKYGDRVALAGDGDDPIHIHFDGLLKGVL